VNESVQHRIGKAMERIRHFLADEGYRPHGLARFHHASACAAADAFDDADLAVQAFGLDDFQEDIGRQYIQIYGVLQAAYLQQHALMRLFDACGLGRLDLPEGMSKLREIRNRAAGHPGPPSKGSPTSKGNTATFLVRFFLSSRNITVNQYSEDGEFVSKTVDLEALLSEHSTEASDILVSISAYLVQAEKETRIAIMKKGEVASLLPQTWRYLLGKCHEASNSLDSQRALWAKAGIPSLQDMISHVEHGLSERKLSPIDDWHINYARDGLERLDTLLQELAHGLDRKLEIAAFATLVEKHFNHISEVLHEIDKDLRANV